MWFVYTILGVTGWSIAIVLDSILVHNYSKNPFVLMWTQSCVSMILLPFLVFTIPFHSSYAFMIGVAAAIAYVGDVVFFIGLGKVEASVINIAWAISAVLLGVLGMILFQESWTVVQTAGSLFIAFGVVFLALWHKHFTFSNALLLFVLACLYVPTSLAEKYAVFNNADVNTVLLWSFAVRELISFVFPWCLSQSRRALLEYIPRINQSFAVISTVVLLSYLVGKFLIIKAMTTGKISLIAVTWNLQPFVVMFMAYCVWVFFPKKASKELFTQQSLFVKITSFVLVSIGASLLIL